MAERWASSPIDEVGRTSVSEQFGRKLIGNCENSRFHVENGAATKGLVDDTAQTRMVWLIHGQHADRERAYPPWHPPAQAGNSAVLAHRERLAVLQNAAGQIAGCGDPGLANDREAHLDDWPGRAEPFDPSGRIAEIVLAGEVDGQRHDWRPRWCSNTLYCLQMVSLWWARNLAARRIEAGRKPTRRGRVLIDRAWASCGRNACSSAPSTSVTLLESGHHS